jgi:outer membrane translocation and assembly module TamA
MDDEKNTVRYQINVAEGDLYKMGELDILGADTASKDRLHEAWKLGEGQPYNADYTRQFLDGTHRFLPPGLHYSVKLSEQLNAKDKTVDVTLHFITQ